MVEDTVKKESQHALLEERSEEKHALANERDNREKHAEHANPLVEKKGRFASLKLWQRVLIIVAICIVALVAILAITVVVMLNVGKADLLASNAEDQSYRTMEVDGQQYAYNEDVTSICIVGTDRLYGDGPKDTNGEADAVMMLVYDTSNADITLINCPRNLMVDFSYTWPNGLTHDYNLFLTAAYSFGHDDASGTEVVCGALSRLFNGIPINNYITLLESCIDPLTAAIGGVTVVSPVTDRTMSVVEGETYELSGASALKFVQYRNIRVMSSPADRMKRQQAFARAFMDQAVDAIKDDPALLMEFYRILTDPDYMTTNLGLPELSYLAYTAVNEGVDNMNLLTIPYTETYDPDFGVAEYHVEEEAFQKLLLDVYYKPVNN